VFSTSEEVSDDVADDDDGGMEEMGVN